MKSSGVSKKGLYLIICLFFLCLPTGVMADKKMEIVENADDICYGDAIEQELVYPNVKRTVPILNQGKGYLTEVILIDATNGKLDDAQFYEFDCGIDDLSHLDSGECVYRKEDEPVGDFRGIEFDWLNSTTTFHGTMLYDMPDYAAYDSHSTYVTHITNMQDLSGIEIYATYIKEKKLYRGPIQSCDPSSDLPFQNEYTCGIFPSVLTSYTHMTLKKNRIFNSCTISYPEKKFKQGHTNPPVCYTDLTKSEECENIDGIDANGNCNMIPPPTNRYDHDFIKTENTDYTPEKNDIKLTQLEYGGYMFNGNNQVIHFNPSKTYSNNKKKVMLLGDVTLTKNNQKLIFEEGDYYFKSLDIQKNGIQIEPKGNVRIFIRDNLIYAGNNASSADPAASLFFYVGGDMSLSSGGGGNGYISAFFYVKGDVEIKSNSKSSVIYGAITAEGKIEVTGNNINFKYNEEGANQFGLGACALCYDPPGGPNGINFFNIVSTCTPFTPCDLYVPVKNISPIPLDAVQVNEARKSLANIGLGTHYTVVDKKGNKVPGTHTDKSSALYADLPLGLNMSLLNGYITYSIGDDYPVYEPEESYYQLHKKINFSMDLLDFSRLVYFGKYRDDANRHYNVQLDPCKSSEIPPSYETGPFDAWDTFRGDTDGDGKFNDKNISTKIAGKAFSLKIANLDANLTGLEAKSISSTVTYGLYDGDTPIEGTFDTFDIKTTLSINKSYTQELNASRNMHVGFIFCSEFDGTSYTLLESTECSGDLIDCNDTDENPRWRRCFSTDAFAIRPKEFVLTPPIGEDIRLLTSGSTHRFTIVAHNEEDTQTDGYDQNDSNLTVAQRLLFKDGEEDTNAVLHGMVDFSNNNFKFVDGISTSREDDTQTEVAGFTFNDVGRVHIILQDNQWTSVDSDDTPQNCEGDTFTNAATGEETLLDGAYICGEQNATFIPAYFDLTGITLRNHNNEGNFTYLSNDLKMSAHVGATIVARNSQGGITQNFRKGPNFYENPVTVSLSVTDWNASLQNRHPLNNAINIKDINVPVMLGFGESDETNGIHTITHTSQLLRFNYQRNNNQPVNPFRVPESDINITVSSIYENNSTGATKTVTGSGVENDNVNAIFYFGRAKASQEFYDVEGTVANTPITVQVYCNLFPTCPLFPDSIQAVGQTDFKHWWLSLYHNETSGDGNIMLQNPTVAWGSGTGAITPNDVTILKGQDSTVEVKHQSGSHPITYDIRLDAPTHSWLIYNPDSPTLDPDPFYEVRFNGNSTWAGVGATGHVLDINASTTNTKRLNW